MVYSNESKAAALSIAGERLNCFERANINRTEKFIFHLSSLSRGCPGSKFLCRMSIPLLLLTCEIDEVGVFRVLFQEAREDLVAVEIERLRRPFGDNLM